MICGTPVVTSSAGNHGIGAISGKHLYVTDDPSEFADNVVSLLIADKWNQFSENGRRFVHDNFSWESSAAKLEQIIERTVEARKATSTST
jgi:glycosyltransferase involved in cell wall biosynthesis